MNTETTALRGTGMSAPKFKDDDSRWLALEGRNSAADGHFYFSVLTTGVFCKPSCGARLPNRDNVSFYETQEAAIKAGYRPCKRCKPDMKPLAERHADIAAQACRTIETAEEEPNLAALAAVSNMSPHHFNRIFKKSIGLTPKQYAIGVRSKNVKKQLETAANVTEAIYAAGYNTASRFYDGAKPRLGMAAAKFKSGAVNEAIRFTIKTTWLGITLIAATENGVCSILFGDNEKAVTSDLQARFSGATLEPSEEGSDFENWVSAVLDYIEAPSQALNIPLDIRGTAFQERVWRALQAIPVGETASYADVAQSIGKPSATRAVAGACAANPVAVVVPCHRVVRSDGGLSGYRWGTERKRQLLTREAS